MRKDNLNIHPDFCYLESRKSKGDKAFTFMMISGSFHKSLSPPSIEINEVFCFFEFGLRRFFGLNFQIDNT